ncbi:unnamed protein product [Adineta steineri]|uniref:Uncharacterized protein n=1 Tax=Adineta steineri TaxID=433720 RepID=A0A814CZP8_9BILA|nr:unnamed protein product [Adineta steineri]
MEHLIPANYQMYANNQKNELVTTEMYKCEGLFANFLQKFQPGYGQMKSVLTESERSAKPSVILSAPDIQRTDEEISEIIGLALEHCLGDNLLKRRRYALINYQKFVFVISGYDFDIENKIRSQPLNDFVYDIDSKSCRSIPSIPSPGRVAFGVAPSERHIIIIGGHTYDNVSLSSDSKSCRSIPSIPSPGRVAFGVAPSERHIIIIGGHTYDNVSLSSVFILDTQNIDEGWMKLPSYPHPVLAPGVAFSENRVIVIGGYDFVIGETDMLSTHYQMDLNEKVWRRYADLNPPRARTLVICTYNNDELELYAAGGYTLVDGKAKVVDKIYLYNKKKDQWEKLTDIPNFQINHVITVAQTKLTISEEKPNLTDSHQLNLHPIRMYDFENGLWQEIEDDK